ncbi:MAG: FAD-binding oxidoreductase [Alphaproteobacteria bacterium]
MDQGVCKSVPDALLARLMAALGPKGCITDAGEIAPFVVDERKLYRGRTPAMLRPASTAEVAEAVRLCAEARVAIVPQGGNTGLCGGATPHEGNAEIVLNLGRMNRVRALDALNYTITVEAGCILAQVQAVAADADRLFPLSLGAEGSCQIGGNLATNAGGVAVLRYGNARDLVLGLEVVLADGRVLDGLTGLRKDNTGYDLKQLFLGSEGTLGIITAAVLKLFPRPREQATAICALENPEKAVALLARVRADSGDMITGFELMNRQCIALATARVPGVPEPLASPAPYYVLVELSSAASASGLKEALEASLGAALEAGTIADAAIASSQAQGRAMWRLREAIPESQKIAGGGIKHDVSVPVSAVPAFIREAELRVRAELPTMRVFVFGHVGDGNVHFNLVWPEGADREAFLARWPQFNRIVHDVAADFGGSISAEHGIGRLKREEFLRYAQPLEVEMMQRVKAALDPLGLMNPGKVLPD